MRAEVPETQELPLRDLLPVVDVARTGVPARPSDRLALNAGYRPVLHALFRLCTEPRRLGPRYINTNPLFLLRVFAQLTGLKKYPLE